MSREGLLPHPRLLFSQSDIARLAEQSRQSHAEIWARILDVAHLAQRSPPPSHPSGLTLDELRYGVAGSLTTLAFAATVGGEGIRPSAAVERLLAICDWPEWGTRPDIEHSHLLFATTLTYDWLHPLLTLRQRRLVASRIGRESRFSFACSQNRFFMNRHGLRVPSAVNASGRLAWLDLPVIWRLRWQNSFRRDFNYNHTWINTAATGLAGLCLAGEVRGAEQWHRSAAHAFQTGILEPRFTGTDGSWHEGTNYIFYQLSLALPYFDALRRQTGVDLYSSPWLRKAGDYVRHTTLPDFSRFLNIGDGLANVFDSLAVPVCRRLAKEFGDACLQWHASKFLATNGRRTPERSLQGEVLEFLGFDAELVEQPPPDDELLGLYLDQGLAIVRTSWEHDATLVSLKSGYFGGRSRFEGIQKREANAGTLNASHDHADNNSLALFHDGEYLVCEAGDHFPETSAHSTVLIDGQGQVGSRREPAWASRSDFWQTSSSLIRLVHDRASTVIVAEAAGAYPKELEVRSFRRFVVRLGRSVVVIGDFIETIAPRHFTWNLLTPHRIQDLDDGLSLGRRSSSLFHFRCSADFVRQTLTRPASLRSSVLASGYEDPAWSPSSDQACTWAATTVRPTRTLQFLTVIRLARAGVESWRPMALVADGNGILARFRVHDPESPRLDSVGVYLPQGPAAVPDENNLRARGEFGLMIGFDRDLRPVLGTFFGPGELDAGDRGALKFTGSVLAGSGELSPSHRNVAERPVPLSPPAYDRVRIELEPAGAATFQVSLAGLSVTHPRVWSPDVS